VASKLRIKIGAVEVEYEGSDDFLKKELPELLKGVVELHARSEVLGSQADDHSNRGGASPRANNVRRGLSTSTAAAKLQSKSGSDLALAAAAAMVIGEGKESFSRGDLLKAMQTAKAHYKGTFRSNLSNYISTLVKSQDLLDHGGDSYGLSDSKRQELEKKLA
jgi:hypothetical protein